MTEDEGAKEKAGRWVVVVFVLGVVLLMLVVGVLVVVQGKECLLCACRFNYGVVKFTDVVEEDKVICIY